MKKVKWQMKESLYSPQKWVMPKSVRKVKVTPRYTADEVEDRAKLTGIYHMAANVKLKKKKENR